MSIALEVMERHGIAAAVSSVVPQGYWGEIDSALRWARHCNEYLARVVQDDQRYFQVMQACARAAQLRLEQKAAGAGMP